MRATNHECSQGIRSWDHWNTKPPHCLCGSRPPHCLCGSRPPHCMCGSRPPLNNILFYLTNYLLMTLCSLYHPSTQLYGTVKTTVPCAWCTTEQAQPDLIPSLAVSQDRQNLTLFPRWEYPEWSHRQGGCLAWCGCTDRVPLRLHWFKLCTWRSGGTAKATYRTGLGVLRCAAD